MEGKQLAKIAIEKESQLSNEALAIRQANQVDGLEVNEDGDIKTFEGEKVEVIARLVNKYMEMMGDVAANLIAEEMKNNDVEPPELPDELVQRY